MTYHHGPNCKIVYCSTPEAKTPGQDLPTLDSLKQLRFAAVQKETC